MKNNHRKSVGPKDAATSKGPNAMAVRATALPFEYPKAGRSRKENPAALKIEAGNSGRANFADIARARAGLAKLRQPFCQTELRSIDGRSWTYRGKRARVVEMLTSMPQGVTQWDCLPWHTRLGGTIHALRRDGLEISTELEGDYRHARYRLHTQVRLIIHRGNSEGPNNPAPEKAP